MRKRIFCISIAAVLILVACAGCRQDETESTSKSQIVNSELKAEAMPVMKENTGDAGAVKDTKAEYETQAKELLQKAFSFDASQCTPTVSDEGGLTSFEYEVKEGDFYYVSYRDEVAYPMMVYHFCHFVESDFDLAKESSEYFKEELVTTAKAFVKKMYGVDCSEAKVHAYGYSIKIAVQLEVAPDQIFHVRFYYDNPDPVGILFYNDVEVFNEAMEMNHAKTYC